MSDPVFISDKAIDIPIEFWAGADHEFQKRGFIYLYKGVCVGGGEGVRFADFISFSLNIPSK